MSNLFSILRNAAGNLGVAQATTATASQNIANANTPGYARQRVEVGASEVADRVGNSYIGTGARVVSVTQVRDRFLEAQLPVNLANAAQSDAEAQVLAAVSALNPDAANGIPNALGEFYATMRALAQNAGDPGLRQAAISAAKALAASMNGTAAALGQARVAVDADLASNVQQLNGLLGQFAELNGKIANASQSGGAPNDLLDSRLRLQDQIVSLTGALPIDVGGGMVNLTLRGGAPLVNGIEAASVAALSDAANDGHLAIQVSSPGVGAFRPVPPNAVGGKLGGLMMARDGALRTAQENLDAFAFDLANNVNAAHQAGFALDGTTGRNLFEVGTTAEGAASRIQINAEVGGDPRLFQAAGSSPVGVGDAGALGNLLDTENADLSNGFPPAQSFGEIISEFGSAASGAATLADHANAMKDHFEALRESQSGVSIDEEMIELTRSQRSFDAVSKVIQIADQMLDTLLKLR